MKTLTIVYPDRLPDALNESDGAFEREARMAMASKLFEAGRISSGIAADMAGLDRVTFMLKLHESGVPLIDLEPGELADDVLNA